MDRTKRKWLDVAFYFGFLLVLVGVTAVSSYVRSGQVNWGLSLGFGMGYVAATGIIAVSRWLRSRAE